MSSTYRNTVRIGNETISSLFTTEGEAEIHAQGVLDTLNIVGLAPRCVKATEADTDNWLLGDGRVLQLTTKKLK